MDIESEIFKRTTVDFKKLNNYGFKEKDNEYIYEKKFLNNEFKAIITIDLKGKVIGKIIDLETNEEYTNIRTEQVGVFVSKVREEYKKILIDIRRGCFEIKPFISKQANSITRFIKNRYNDDPEFLWERTPGCGVFRDKNSKKWYGIIMNIDLSKLENANGEVEIINVKLNRNKIQELLNKKGFYKAYHMSKVDWISIVLNDTLKDKEIFSLIEESHDLIIKKTSKSNETLLANMDKIHTTKMGATRIKKNLDTDTSDVVEYLKNKIKNKDCDIYKQGKNWYCQVDNIIITINSSSYTIITAHQINP